MIEWKDLIGKLVIAVWGDGKYTVYEVVGTIETPSVVLEDFETKERRTLAQNHPLVQALHVLVPQPRE